MRIGLVLPSASAYSETFFYNKIKGLEAHGFKVLLFVNANTNASIPDSITIKVAPKLSGPFYSVIWVSLCSLVYSFLFHYKVSQRLYTLNKNDGDSFLLNLKNIIINSHILSESMDWLHFGYGTMALGRENVASAIGAKMAVSFRGFDIGIYPIKHPNCYNRLWKKLDKIHVISDDIGSLIYNYGFKGEVPVIKITPAIDTTFFKSNPKTKPNIIPQFVTIARLHWKKGLDYTLEALALLKQENVKFHYTIIGEGPLYECLKFSTYQLGLHDLVTFTGKLSHELVKKQLEQSDIYLQYSIQEGFCNAVLEAQAMGLLCVVSDAEGLSENVLDGYTGWVVPKRQPKHLANQLMEVISISDNEKLNISQQAQQRVQDQFNLESQNEAFATFYNN